MEMYNNEIELETHEGGSERLERVVGYAYALGEHYGNLGLLDKVVKLYDRKGVLTVTWSVEPTDGEREIFVKAWESRIGDGAPNVEHEVEPHFAETESSIYP